MGESASELDDRVIVVVGPTASGKSDLAEHLAMALGGEIVSADALQVYQGLDIGTAKPAAETRDRIPHHCIDLFPPDGRCTAGAYGRRARGALADVAGRGGIPILAGGSGFYIRAALEGLDRLPPTDPAWRAALTDLAERRRDEELHRWLRRLDPDRAREVEANDRHRLVRALEVILRTGLRIEEQPGPDHPPIIPLMTVGLRWPRDQLYARIEGRVDRMLEAGWLAEVEGLLARGLSAEDHALQAIGYRELVAVCRGRLSLDEARESIARETRGYAKRQLAWFRKQSRVDWYEVDTGRDESSPRRVRDRVLVEAEARLSAQ